MKLLELYRTLAERVLPTSITETMFSKKIEASYKNGWLVNTKAGDRVRIVATMTYQFEEIGEPLYFVQSKKTGESYSLRESESKPKEKK